jgi:hypothetical protein
MRITIPFSFTAGDETLPAGTYTVRRTSQSGSAFLLQSEDHDSSAAILAGGTLQSGRRPQAARLVFNVYGGEHFLAEVWMPWRTIGNEVKSSDAEERLAQIHEKELVAVAARR